MFLTPHNDPAMMDFVNLIQVWTARHQLSRVEELRRVGAYLADRLNVNADFERVSVTKPLYEE